MNKRIFAIVLNLLLLIMLSTTTAFAAIPNTSVAFNIKADFTNQMLGKNDPTVLYGPPLPQNIPTLASRGGADLLKIPAPQPQNLTYNVQAGDSLSAIASAFGTDVESLAQLNNITNPALLQIGQQLKIPNLTKTLSANYQIKQVMSANLTAYTAGFESTGKNPGDPDYGITATGTHVKDGETIAVDPSVIPLGSKVYIEGIGVRVAEDTGGAIIGNRIDVYMSDLSTAIQFGFKRNIKVYILSDKAQQPQASV
ncbi:MAG: 3D domain-containing protein [Tumebacillaceae bacterium]